MIKKFLKKYLAAYVCFALVYGGLIYNNIVDWGSFCGDILWLNIVVHLVLIGGITGLTIHGIQWYRRNKTTK